MNPIDEKGESFIRDTYHFKELVNNLGVQEEDLIGSLDIVGMFPNVPLKKTLEVVREELHNDDTLHLRTEWEIDDIMKLLEISIETYFKTLDGKFYFQRDGLLIGKSISKPLAGIYICIGSRRHMSLMRIINSETISVSGKGKWTTYFSCGRVVRRI